MTSKKMKFVGHSDACKDCEGRPMHQSWEARVGKICYLLDDQPTEEGTIFVRFDGETYPAMTYFQHLEPA